MGLSGAVRALGLSLILPFVPLYLRNVLGLSFVEIGAIAVLVGVGPMLVNPVGGLLTDRFGRRRLLLIALAAEAATTLGLAAAMRLGSVVGAVGGMVAISLAGTFAGPASTAYVADLSTGPERTRGYTWLRVGWNVGFALGVAAGGLALGTVGFDAVALFGGIAIGLSTGYLAWALDPSPFDVELARPSLPTGPTAARPARRSMGASLRRIAHDRTFLTLCLAIALAELVWAQWILTFPLFANTRLGIPYPVIGIGLALNGVIVVLGQTVTTEASIGHRLTSVAILGTVLYALGFLVLGISGLWQFFPTAVFFGVIVVLTVGENLTSISYSTLPPNVAAPGEVGAYSGSFYTLTGFGPLAAQFIGGLALGSISNPLVLWAVLVSPTLPAVWLLRRIARRLPAGADRA